MASSHPRLRPVLRSLTVMLGPPLLLKLALVQRSLHRPLAPALELVRQQRLLALQQTLGQGQFHGCYQQSRDELLHVVGWLQNPAVAPDQRLRRFGR